MAKKENTSVQIAMATGRELDLFSRKTGVSKTRLVEAGIRAITLMPSDLRDRLMAGDDEYVRQRMSLDNERLAAIDAEIQRQVEGPALAQRVRKSLGKANAKSKRPSGKAG